MISEGCAERLIEVLDSEEGREVQAKIADIFDESGVIVEDVLRRIVTRKMLN